MVRAKGDAKEVKIGLRLRVREWKWVNGVEIFLCHRWVICWVSSELPGKGEWTLIQGEGRWPRGGGSGGVFGGHRG